MSELTDEARSHLQMLTPQKRERKTAKLLAKLADDNARLQTTLNEINGYSGEVDWYKRSAAKCNELEADNARLKSWVSDCQAGMYINCVYCGHRYGSDTEIPSSMADVLKEHIEQCPKHPMSKLKADNARLTKMLELAARGIIIAVPLEHFDGLLWRAKYDVSGVFWEFVCTTGGYYVDYNTPIEALEAAYAEWKKRENSG